MEENVKILEQYRELTENDHAPQGTLCNVIYEDDKEQLFIQSHKDEKNPKWMPIGKFFEVLFSDDIHRQQFIQECIRIYNSLNSN